MSQQPTIGRIVIYSSKIGGGVKSPAIVLRTRDTTVPEVVERWGPEPRTVTSALDPSVTHETARRPESFVAELPDDDTIDLLVHGLGKDYREYAVPHDPDGGPGTWDWPVIVRT